MKQTFGLVLLLFITLQIAGNSLSELAKVEYVQAEEVEVETVLIRQEWSKEGIQREIEEVAKEYGVSKEVMETVVNCESNFNRKALGDGGKSRGLAQIHSFYHPDVSDEEAYNPEFALRFLALHLQQDKGYLWSCYNKNYGE